MRLSRGALAWCVVLAACAEPVELSDTGFAGTWNRGSATTTSTIALARDGARYLWRGRVDSVDGKLRVRCDWDGACEEWVDGRKTAEWRCAVEPESERVLLLECRGRVILPEERERHDKKRLELSEDGLALNSRLLEQDGRSYENGPVLDFRKVSDAVTDPPPRRPAG